MRIAFVSTGTPSTFGTNYRVLGLARQLVRQGLEVDILLPNWPENREWMKSGAIENVSVHFTETGAWSEMASKYRLLRSLQPDVVHCIDVVKRNFLPAYAHCRRRGHGLVVDVDEYLSRVYQPPVSWYATLAERMAARGADAIVAASRFLEREFTRLGARRVHYLPNAVDLEFFEQHKIGWEGVKQRWPGRRILTYLGTLHARFDAELVLEAAIQILKERRDLIFLFIGGGPQVEDYRRHISSLGLADHVLFLGFVPDDDLPKYLVASDLLLFPIRDNLSNRARCPGKVYHYIAAGVPVVTNRVGEVAEALGDCGYYFEDGNIDDLCRTINQVLAAGEGSGRPSATLANEHSWQERATAYVKFLRVFEG